MKHLYSFPVALFLLSPFFMAAPAPAQEKAPVVVMSVSGMDTIVKKAGALGTVIGMPLDKMLEGGIAGFTGGKGFAGLDKTKPFVVAMWLGDQEPVAVACWPVTDAKQLLASVEGQVGTPEDAGDGIQTLPNAPNPTFIKEGNGWLYLAPAKEHLANAPADPLKLVGDLPTKYMVGIRASVQDVPKEYRDMFLDQIRRASELQDDPLGQKVAQRQLQRMERNVADLDNVTIGLDFDEQGKKVVMEFSATAISESPTAKAWANFKEGPSQHSGLLAKDAAVTFLSAAKGPRPAGDIAILDAQHKQARARALDHIQGDAGIPETAKAPLSKAVGQVIDIAFETLKSDTFDMGLAIFADQKSTLVAGSHVKDGVGFEQAIKDIVKVVQDQGEDLPPIKWDAETHQGYKLHTVEMTVPDPQAAQFVGDTIQGVLATSADSILLAAGGDGINRIKQVIDASAAGKANPAKLMEMKIALGPIAKMAGPMDPTGMAKLMAAQLQDGGNIGLTGNMIPNGMSIRLEVEESILKTIGTAAQMFGGGGGPPGGLPPGL